MTTPPEPPDRWPTTADQRPDDPQPAASGPVCGSCGAEGAEPGFLEDQGESSRGYLRWVTGPLERGPFGGAKRFGKERLIVVGRRCTRCGHLDLFANEPA